MKNNVQKDSLLAKWLTEFKKERTQYTYYHALINFKKIVGIPDLATYVNSQPNVAADLRTFLAAYDGKPSKTVSTYIGAIRSFLLDNKVQIPNHEWRNIRRRGFMPKRVRAETQDKKNSKSELRQILNYADVKTRALVLFLVSSGARIGETLQLKDQDLDLDADPPQAIIRDEYTKGGYGGRTVYFSYEARDTIKDWLRIRDTTRKHMKGAPLFKSERIFPWVDTTARKAWNLAIHKAGLDVKDVQTNRRIYHLHALRKFFKSNIGLEENVTEILMGYVAALNHAYIRRKPEEIAREYQKAMANVEIFTKDDAALRDQTNSLEEKIQRLQQENRELKAKLNGYGNQTSELQTLRNELEELRTLVKTQLGKRQN